MLAETDTASAELTHVAMWTTSFDTAVLSASWARVAWQLGQTFLITKLLELCTLCGVLCNHLLAL